MEHACVVHCDFVPVSWYCLLLPPASEILNALRYVCVSWVTGWRTGFTGIHIAKSAPEICDKPVSQAYVSVAAASNNVGDSKQVLKRGI